MAQTLIIGYGNPMRSDDGLGVRAAEEFSSTLNSAETEVLVCHQLTPELAEVVSHVERVVFVDAARDGEPGELRCRPVTPCLPEGSFSHQLSPAAIVALAGMLYGTCPVAFEVSLSGKCFAPGEALSGEVMSEMPAVVRLLKEMAGAGTRIHGSKP